MAERREGTRTSSDAASQPTQAELERDDAAMLAAAVADKQIQRWKGDGGAWLPSD